jgi:hypothetical protein
VQSKFGGSAKAANRYLGSIRDEQFVHRDLKDDTGGSEKGKVESGE